MVIVADPGISTHIVEIAARGRFGSFTFREDVIPTESNPKTGRLVAMAVIKTVRQLDLQQANGQRCPRRRAE